MLNLNEYKREQIEGKYGKLEKLTKGNATIIGGGTGSGKTHYVMGLVGELVDNGQDVKVLSTEEDAVGYLGKILDLNVDADLNGELVVQYITNRGEDLEKLVDKIEVDCKHYDIIVIDSVHVSNVGELIDKLEDMDGKEFIFAVQLGRKFFTENV